MQLKRWRRSAQLQLWRIFSWPGPPKGPAGFETAACGRVTTAKAPRMRLRGPTRAKEATRVRCLFPYRHKPFPRQIRNRLILRRTIERLSTLDAQALLAA